jgi:hypothetical protein
MVLMLAWVNRIKNARLPRLNAKGGEALAQALFDQMRRVQQKVKIARLTLHSNN